MARIGLPQYGWTVTATRASRAIMAGQYADAARLCAEARAVIPSADPMSLVERNYTLQMVLWNWDKDR